MEESSRDGHALHLESAIAAPRAEAWRAFTDAGALSTWFTTGAEVDLRPGGAYRNGDGDRGEFLAVEAPRHLRFTWDNPGHCPGTVVDVSFEEAGDGGTLVRLAHEGLESAEAAGHMREGWEWALANLGLWLEEGRTVTFEAWQAARG